MAHIQKKGPAGKGGESWTHNGENDLKHLGEALTPKFWADMLTALHHIICSYNYFLKRGGTPPGLPQKLSPWVSARPAD